MASRIQQSFGVELTLRALFAAPTIVALTALVTAQQLEQNELDEAARVLDELSQLSPEEVRALLEAEEHQA
jgi:RecA/RadA recombinase